MQPAVINDEIFRGYDIRGIAGKDLNSQTMTLLGKAYATFLYQRQINEAVVGMDIRKSSGELKVPFIQALLDSGINVTDIGLSLTQIVYFAQYHYLSKGGAMISASHNPREYNGLKLAVGFSDTMVSKEIQETKQIVHSGNFKRYPRQGVLKIDDVFPSYKTDLLKRVSLGGKKFKIVVDSIATTTGKFLPEIFREAGCEVIEKNTTLDDTFPLGTPDPTEREHMQRLADEVIEAKADLGFTYDCDGDRVGIVDETGRLIWNDVLVALFAKDILYFLPGSPIVFNTLCSKVVSDTIKTAGGKPEIWLTGHSFIKARVKETRAPFGGELSGHFFFMDNFFGHDDGAFASLRLLSYLARTGKSLKQAVDELPKYVSSPEIKLGLADAIKFKFIQEKIAPDLKKLYPNAEYLDIDGIRMDTPETMAIVRASQNGPYITIKFEGKTEDQYHTLKNQMRGILKAHPEIDWSYGVNTNAFD